MHYGILSLYYIFNNDAFFLFSHTKIPFDFFKLKSFLTLTSPAFWGSEL